MTTLKAFVRFGFVLLALLGPAGAALSAEKTRLVVYTAIEEEQVRWVGDALAQALPDLDLVWVRASTGAITDRLIAEQGEPKADIAYGIGASNLIVLKRAGLLAAYVPQGADRLRSFFRDGGPDYSWTGMDAYLGAICFNADRAAEARIPAPVFWRDLLAPELKGLVAMPDPNVSGTGLLLVAGWLQSMGEAAAWRYMDALDANVAAYLPSGSAPCKGAVAGSYLAGLSFDMRAATEKAKGAPIDIVVPLDGVGWEQEAFAILRSSRQLDAAKRLLDWSTTREANEIYARSFAIVAYPGVSNPNPAYPSHAEARMIRNDLPWVAENRERILREWTRRYGGKARAAGQP